jgi:hypothetical protein
MLRVFFTFKIHKKNIYEPWLIFEFEIISVFMMVFWVF